MVIRRGLECDLDLPFASPSIAIVFFPPPPSEDEEDDDEEDEEEGWALWIDVKEEGAGGARCWLFG